MTLFLTNLVLALAWGAWQGRFSLDTLLVGFVVGLGLLRLGLPLYQGDEGYFRRVWGFAVFLAVFAKEMYNSTLGVAKTVLFSSVKDLHPSLVTLDSRDLRPFEVLLLTHCITLTPGTTSVDVDKDKGWILVHALDGRKPAAVRKSIEDSLKAAILRFTR